MNNWGLAYLGIAMGIILDVYGMICVGIDKMHIALGEMMSLIGDGVGMIFFAAWTAIMAGGIGSLKNFKNKGMMQQFLMTSVLELVPVIGGLPFWTIYAIRISLKNREPKKAEHQESTADDEPRDEDVEESEEDEANDEEYDNDEPGEETEKEDNAPKDENIEEYDDPSSEEDY
jgi:hypothetical protein